MNLGIKILLFSDLHLGMDQGKLPISSHMRLKTFGKIMSLAKKCDLLLIGRDLFDSNLVDYTIHDIVNNELLKLISSGVEVVFCPGKGELTPPENSTTFLKGLNVSHCFRTNDSQEPYHFIKNDQELFIYGAVSDVQMNNITVKKVDDKGFHLGLYFTEIDIEKQSDSSNMFKMQKRDFKESDLDFYAFGCNHQFKILKANDRVIGAYAGSPEATSLNELGDRYAVLIHIKDNELKNLKRYTVNSVKLMEEIFDCTVIESFEGIRDRIDSLVDRKSVV